MSQAALTQSPVTGEEFFEFCHSREGWFELVDGRIVEMSPPAAARGRIDSVLSGILGPFVRRQRLGEHYMNSGFILRRDPDVVRAPDEAFVSQARVEANPPPERGYWELAPDLAVEIISPEDRAGEIEEKVRDYLQAGVRLVWLLYPLTRRAHVYAADGSVRVILEERELDGEDVLPGFRAPLAELFD